MLVVNDDDYLFFHSDICIYTYINIYIHTHKIDVFNEKKRMKKGT